MPKMIQELEVKTTAKKGPIKLHAGWLVGCIGADAQELWGDWILDGVD